MIPRKRFTSDDIFNKGPFKRTRQAQPKMSIDLNATQPNMIRKILEKMDYKTFSKMRCLCTGMADFIDYYRRQIKNGTNVFALQFMKDEYSYIRPKMDGPAFPQDDDVVVSEFLHLKPRVVGFHTFTLECAKKRAPYIRKDCENLELIADFCDETAIIYLTSLLHPKMLYIQGTEVSEDLLFQPGMSNVKTLHIRSPQTKIDLSPCNEETRILMVDFSHGDCPVEDILRLIKLWEKSNGQLQRMEFTYNDEFDSFPLCVALIGQTRAVPLFIREIHQEIVLAPIPIEMFASPHFDRLFILANKNTDQPAAGVLLIQRGKFIFETVLGRDEFYASLNRHGNKIFKKNFEIDYRQVVDIFEPYIGRGQE